MSSQLQTYDPGNQPPITLLPHAVEHLRTLLAEKPKPHPSFRVYVTGGGCSGFQYGFKFDDTQLDEDTSVEQDGINVLIDSLSIQYLDGSQLDYQQSLTGSRFSVINPNATTQCSCGASFSM